MLIIRNLTICFRTPRGDTRAVDDLSLNIAPGEVVGIVGESGCGKSVLALSIMGLLPKPPAFVAGGEILFKGQDLLKLASNDLRLLRGNQIGMIFQEPMTALNPVHRIGRQIGEVFHLHFPDMPEPAVLEASVAMLRKVGIPEPEQRMREYAHQISGGMRQRVMIAMALACRPDILIADEPTTALDVTIQAQILALIRDLQAETGMSVIIITHDLGVIAETCDTVAVMYAGKTAETAPVAALFRNPRHPYTRGLLSSIPRLDFPRKTPLNVIRDTVPDLRDLPEGCRFRNRCPYAKPLCRTQPPMAAADEDHFAACHFADTLPPFDMAAATATGAEKSGGRRGRSSSDCRSSEKSTADNRKENDSLPTRKDDTAGISLDVQDLTMHFPIRGGIFRRQTGKVHAVDGVSFAIRRGRSLGLVGESGCGKTTVGRSILRLYEPTAGTVRFNGDDILAADRTALHTIRRNIQIIFQDPFESLNSRLTIGDILEEPFIIHRIGDGGRRRQKVQRLLDTVGLPANALGRFPHEFSGGQRQRIGIARAIALNPEILVCDEPVSALDVSIQSQILNLLLDLQKEMGLTYLFISHDLTVVRHISDHVAVMYLGRIVERTDADTIYECPLHPYTQALLSAIPVPEPGARHQKQVLGGDVPSPVHPPSGCRFRTRCPIRIDRCIHEEPLLRNVGRDGGTDHWVACHRVP